MSWGSVNPVFFLSHTFLIDELRAAYFKALPVGLMYVLLGSTF
jgi:hypothetical protein